VSIGLIVALIVGIAVVMIVAIDDDGNRTDRTAAPAAPLSYIHDGMGEGFVSGEGEAVVPALRSHTSELQGEGHLNTLDDLSVYRPTDRPTGGYHPYSGEVGLTEGSTSYLEQARRANDEMLFEEWNDPLGWQAIEEPEPVARTVIPYDRMIFLEQNGVYDFDRFLAAVPEQPVVDETYMRMRYIEWNTNLPGETNPYPQSRGHGQLTEH
jgi:hypothetical protein